MSLRVVSDTSALLESLLGESERGKFLELLSESETRLLSAANALETAIVVESRRGEAAGRELDLFLHRTKIEIVAGGPGKVSLAPFAWRQYGKSRHPPPLNFWNCFSYAPTQNATAPPPATDPG